jgi:hypothetical protein
VKGITIVLLVVLFLAFLLLVFQSRPKKIKEDQAQDLPVDVLAEEPN